MAVATAKRREGTLRGTRSGIPAHARDVPIHQQNPDADGYDWGVDVAGQISLGGLKLLLNNRASLRIRSPLRLS